jgi:hypothetical protein
MNPDWISPWWQALVLPDRWGVCGMTVPPLSVWHVYALENIGNQFFADNGNPTIDDVASVMMIASQDMANGKRLLWSEGFKSLVSKRVVRKIRKHTHRHCIEACKEYVEECTRHGRRMKKSDGGTCVPAGTPEPWSIVCNLLRCGVSFNDAWNMPYAQARAIMDGHDESSGNTLMTPVYGEHMHDNWGEYKKMTGTKEVALN